MSQLATPSLIFIILLYILLLTIGIWTAKKMTHLRADELLVNGRNLNAAVAAIAITASAVAGRFISQIAETVYDTTSINGGLIWCQEPLATAISLLIGGLLFASPMRSKNYLTVLDPCSERYGAIMAGVLFIPLALYEFVSMGASLSYFGDILFRHSFLNIGHAPVFFICVGATSVSITYCFLGGIRSVVYTDVAKVAIIFCGLWIFAPCALANYNFVRCIRLTFDQWLGHLPPVYGGVYFDNYIVAITCGLVCQSYFQRILSVRNANQARIASMLAAVLCILIAAPSALIGAVGKSTDWNRTEIGHSPTDKEIPFIFNTVLQTLTPPVIASVAIGVIAVATISAFDNSLLSLSTMFVSNVRPAFVRSYKSEKQHIRWFKVCVINCGVIGTALGCVVLPYRGIKLLLTDIISTAVFPQLVCALFVPKCNGYGSLSAIGLTTIARLLFGEPSLSRHLTVVRLPLYNADLDVQLFPYRSVLLLVSLASTVLFSKLATYGFVKSRKVPIRFDFLHVFDRSVPDLLSTVNSVPMRDQIFDSQESVAAERTKHPASIQIKNQSVCV
ncbi:high-affinity choline transporter 1-like [Paramacrobiotus metropolitanus]|uniref:high-affinity choline transporter 1-like n=1 Tax=Paramacrobiotus metropolitanus TaxID=2943436 RepID=UPI0024462B22|nr:high-affinity choline transporter 1-like [Paramacrobiotus metropolitanus]